MTGGEECEGSDPSASVQYWDQFLSQFDNWNVTVSINSQKGAPEDNKITISMI